MTIKVHQIHPLQEGQQPHHSGLAQGLNHPCQVEGFDSSQGLMILIYGRWSVSFGPSWKGNRNFISTTTDSNIGYYFPLTLAALNIPVHSKPPGASTTVLRSWRKDGTRASWNDHLQQEEMPWVPVETAHSSPGILHGQHHFLN